jgi:hypothetical protein
MQAATYDLEESMPPRFLLSQVATTLFLGIPMTIALVIALAVYCTYECIKYALSDKRRAEPTAKEGKRDVPADVSEEQAFTSALTQFAGIHAATPAVGVPGKPEANPAADGAEERTEMPASTNKQS